jgi:RnfABCDGE-type electron transport complex D subunit
MTRPTIFERLARTRVLRPVASILTTLDGIVFGSRELTPGAPHLLDHIEIKRYMTTVIIALLPATVAAVVFYGTHVLAMIVVSYLAGAVVEVAFALIRKKEIEEGFLVTGLIFPLVLPPTSPLWVVAVGMVFGVFFGKEIFGGTGRNIFNPALVGRLFVTIAFPGMMSSMWQVPFTDAISSATPLSLFKAGEALPALRDMFLGLAPGSMGETFRVGIIAGGLLLMATRVANWRIPITFLATVVLGSLAASSFAPSLVAPPLVQLATGGLLFGAMFMATDPVTSPLTRTGKYIFGFGCGAVTLLIRSLSGYVEGVMFAIVFMNAFVPLIDHLVLGARYQRKKT